MEKFSDTLPLSATMLITLAVFGALISEATEIPARVNQVRIVAQAPAVQPTTDPALTLVVARAGNSARYQIQEQLVGIKLPSLAIGQTSGITGSIALDSAGRVIRSASQITVDVKGLRSDSDRRDGYVRGRVLETDRYPTVQFIPTSIAGLTNALSTSGTKRFDLVGDLTVHGVTRPATWHVEATFDGDRVTGAASTTFTFADFGLTQPRVPVVLSVDDTIQLYYDFVLLRDAPQL
jgi:polyisoprenoid-binding protein YceI